MTNLPSIAKLPPPTPCVASSLSSDDLALHRQKASFEVEVVLQGYWQTEMSAEMKAAVMADWADEMQDWQIVQIRWALRQWRGDNPRRKPNPGDIVAILKVQRGRAEMAKVRSALAGAKHEAPAPKPDPERVAQIMADLGFTPKRMPEVRE